MKEGDIIIKIDGKSTENMSVDDAVDAIRGPIGTTVTLSVLPKGKTSASDIKGVTITRDTISIPDTDTKMRSDGIYVISLYNFDAQSADQFRSALQQFQASGGNKLILDLRGNPGGYLEAAVDIASWFLPQGKLIVTEDYGAKQSPDVYTSLGYDAFKGKNLHMAILVDGGTASAAEILAGALSQNGVGTLVGEKTFGKGSVQEVIPLTDDTQLKVTVGRWLTPNGTWISKNGLMPQYVASTTDADIAAGKDPQMDEAASLINNGTI